MNATLHSAYELEITRAPSDSDAETISKGVIAYGRALAVAGNAQPVACFVREQGVLIAGGVGRTEYDRLFVNFLWVIERERSRGLGSAVLMKLEDAAMESGCRSALIETFGDRMAALYGRLGYETVSVVEGYVGPFRRYTLVKRF